MSENRKHVKALLKRLSGQDSTLTIQREYILLCDKDHLAALLLSQIIYWSDRSDDPEGWVAKSYAEWEHELCMSQYQVNRAAEKLKSLGVEVLRKRSKYHKGGSTLHYRVDMDTLTNQIIKFLDNQEVELSHHQETSQSHHQETSQTDTESTPESTTERDAQRAKPQEVDRAIYAPSSNETANVIPMHMQQFERHNNSASHPWVVIWRELRGIPKYHAKPAEMRLITEYATEWTADDFRRYAAQRLKDRPNIQLRFVLEDMPEALSKKEQPTKTTGVDFSAKLAEMGITPDSPEYTETINRLMAEHYAERERRAQAIHAKQFEKVAS